MKRYFRVFLFSIFLMFGLFDNANAASRMYIVPVSSADFTYIDDYVDIDVAYNTPCGRDNYDGYSGHEGMDFVLDLNTPVYAAASGTVHRDDSGNDYVQICSSVAANCYGYYMAIDHGGGNWTLYAHLNSYVVADGVYVNQGDLIAYSGNSGPTYPHLHWEVLTGGSSPPVNSHPNNPYYCDNEWFTSNPPTYADEYNAIDSKADELWAIRPRGSVSCDDHSRGGLICHEIQDMHWTDGDDPFILETWHDGAWGDVALTYDPDSNQGDRAYVVRSGFWADYQQRDWDVFGAPLGDELDENDSSGYSAYDPYCTPLYGSSNKASCIAAYCGSSRTFTSVQRFEHATLCWNNVLRVTQCDPTWSNPACSRNSRSATSVWSPAKGDLYDVNGTVYWYDGLSLRGIVSSDVFDSCGFNWGDVQEESEDVLDPLGWGENVDDPVDCGVLKDGDVFTTDATTTVYQYQAGLKRGITSSDVFNSCGFDWDQIKTFPDSSITSIPDGSVISSSSMCYLTPDLIWRELSSGNLAAWYMAGTGISSSSSISSSDLSWEIVGSGDFNRDGSLDILWRHLSSPYELYLWEMSGSIVSSSILIAGSTDSNWVIRGVSDFTSDGEPDILWKEQSTGELAVWVMEGTVISSSEQVVATSSDTSWDIRATGDLTGDGSPDILWRNPSTGTLGLWQMDGTSYVSSITISSSSVTSWDIKAIGDFTSDGINDLLWRNPTTGELSVWQMNGTSYVSSASMTTSSPAWDLVTVGGMSN